MRQSQQLSLFSNLALEINVLLVDFNYASDWHFLFTALEDAV